MVKFCNVTNFSQVNFYEISWSFYENSQKKNTNFQMRGISHLQYVAQGISFKTRPTPSKLIKKFQSYFNKCEIILAKKKAEISRVKVYAIFQSLPAESKCTLCANYEWKLIDYSSSMKNIMFSLVLLYIYDSVQPWNWPWPQNWPWPWPYDLHTRTEPRYYGDIAVWQKWSS